jgi:hypothetical protein
MQNTQSATKLILAALFLAALGAFFAWQFGPLLVRDFGIKETVQVANARITEGKCKTRLIVSICELKIARPGAAVVELDYAWLDLPFTDHTATPLLAAHDRTLLTTDLGQDMLWNRAVTLGAFLALLFCPLVFVPIVLVRRSRTRDGEATPA